MNEHKHPTSRMSDFGLVRTIGISPENWQTISKEIRGDPAIPMWIRALVSVFVSKPYREAVIGAEIIGRICRARSLSTLKEERPLYDPSQKPSPINFTAISSGSHKGPHGTEEAITRLLLRRSSSADRRPNDGTLGREGQDSGTAHRAVEDRQGERGSGHGSHKDPRTPPETGRRSEFDSSTDPATGDDNPRKAS